MLHPIDGMRSSVSHLSPNPHLTLMRVATGGTGVPGPPPFVAAGAPQMKILQMGLHASDLAPLSLTDKQH